MSPEPSAATAPGVPACLVEALAGVCQAGLASPWRAEAAAETVASAGGPMRINSRPSIDTSAASFGLLL